MQIEGIQRYSVGTVRALPAQAHLQRFLITCHLRVSEIFSPSRFLGRDGSVGERTQTSRWPRFTAPCPLRFAPPIAHCLPDLSFFGAFLFAAAALFPPVRFPPSSALSGGLLDLCAGVVLLARVSPLRRSGSRVFQAVLHDRS